MIKVLKEASEEWVERNARKKEDGFNQLIAALMSADMKRKDTLEQNIKFLEKEAEELEKDVSLLGIMLGKSIQAVEEKEDREEPEAAVGKKGYLTTGSSGVDPSSTETEKKKSVNAEADGQTMTKNQAYEKFFTKIKFFLQSSSCRS